MSVSVLSDEQLEAVLMVGYGYHRSWDHLYDRSCWVKGWLPGAPTNPLNDETPETWQEYEQIEEQVANGELCSADGKPCDWETKYDWYAEDADGNRGIRYEYKVCCKCGDER